MPPAVPPRVRRAEEKLFADPVVARELSDCLSAISEFPMPDPQTVGALQGVSSIDAGELLLVGALVATPGARLLTGDKRAIAAIAREAVGSFLQGRLLCVEQLLWSALDHYGPAALLMQVRKWPIRDMAALAIFGREGNKAEGELREGLSSYICDLDAAAPGLLHRGYGLTD